MTSRAEWFRYFAERAGPKRVRQQRPVSRDPAADRNVGTPSRHAGKKAGYALESCEGRPSRKATRGSANRQKNDIQFRMKRRVSEGRAEHRATRSAP